MKGITLPRSLSDYIDGSRAVPLPEPLRSEMIESRYSRQPAHRLVCGCGSVFLLRTPSCPACGAPEHLAVPLRRRPRLWKWQREGVA